jgi:hypothetical protein
MVSVEMSEEDVVQREARAVAHHLPLRAFATLEKQRLSLTL